MKIVNLDGRYTSHTTLSLLQDAELSRWRRIIDEDGRVLRRRNLLTLWIKE